MKLSVKPKRIKHRIGPQFDDIERDDSRRLRNALLALADLDRGWMDWVDRHVSRLITVKAQRVIIERRARTLLSARYGFMGWGSRLGIIYSDFYFTDDGALKMYL